MNNASEAQLASQQKYDLQVEIYTVGVPLSRITWYTICT